MLKRFEKFHSWNPTRYGTPWFARIVLKDGVQHWEYDAGAFKGDEKGGVIEADVDDGEFIAWGQQDCLGIHTVIHMGRYSAGEFIELTQKRINAELMKQKAETDRQKKHHQK